MADDLLKLNNLAGLAGFADCETIDLGGHGVIIRLPDQECKFAMIAQWTVGVDAARTAKTGATASQPRTGAAGVEIYWGFNGKLFAQLFTGERTELLPVNNLNQICASGTGVLFYAWFN